MKDFLKYTLASIVGLLLCTIIVTILGVISVAGIVASSKVVADIEGNSLFKLELKGEVT